MVDIRLTTEEIVCLLVKHGEKFVCCIERADVGPFGMRCSGTSHPILWRRFALADRQRGFSGECR